MTWLRLAEQKGTIYVRLESEEDMHAFIDLFAPDEPTFEGTIQQVTFADVRAVLSAPVCKRVVVDADGRVERIDL